MEQNYVPPAIKKAAPLKKQQVIYNLEALRGFAAVFVILHHVIFYNKYIDSTYFPKFIKYLEPSGHLSVLIFFVLSGYVIGISNTKPLSKDQFVPYLKKRFIRIYPIYFICLTITLFVATIHYPFQTILSNFTLTQGALSPVIWENNPIWSLNYEVFYYLLFIPISYFNINTIGVAIFSLFIAFVNYSLPSNLQLPIISAYFWGFSFWVTGLAIAKYITQKESSLNFSRLLSCLLLIFVIPSFNFFANLLFKATSIILKRNLEFPETVYWAKRMVSFYDLSFLPYCFLFVLVFSEKAWKYKKLYASILLLLPFLGMTTIYRQVLHTNSYASLIVPSISYALSLLLWYTNLTLVDTIGQKIIKVGIWLGSVSYGIYIIHFPILIVMGRISFLTGSAAGYFVRIVFYLAITLLISYVLEKKVQLWVRKKFLTNNNVKYR